MTTCAIVVNWNGWQDTIHCLETLFAQDVPLHVVICDNGSTDGSMQMLLQWLDQHCPDGRRDATPRTRERGVQAVQLLPLASNLGYAGALNAGIRWARETWGVGRYWLLNNDVEAQPDALRALQQAHAAIPDAGVCGSVLMNWERPDQVQAVAGRFHRWLGVGDHVRRVPAGEVLVDPDYPVGASLYVEQDYLDHVGPMDDSYFLYCEEMDWVERGRRHGFVPVVALASRLKHKEGASTGSRGGVRNKSFLSERFGVVNRLRITCRFWPFRLPVVWLSLWLVVADRLFHREYRRAALVLRLMFSPQSWLAERESRPGIVYCQLNDDNSGSPRVLVHSMRALAARFPNPLAFVSSSRSGGFLARSRTALRRYPFRSGLRHPWLAMSYLGGQLQLLLQLAASRPRPAAPVYVNTCLPVGGALYGLLSRRPVIFHSHEIPRSWFERVAFAITVRCSDLLICVSQAHAAALPVPSSRSLPVLVVPNALDPEFARRAGQVRRVRDGTVFRVMYASAVLSPQKGFEEFVRLAEALRERGDIQLLLAAPSHEIAPVREALPPNIQVWSGDDGLGALYASVDAVLNLSRPDLCVETFGLTVLEAMAFGTPVVVPPVGGPAELVRDGEEGYHIDSRDTGKLVEVLAELAADDVLWHRLSAAARKRAGRYGFPAYEAALAAALDSVLPRTDAPGSAKSSVG